MHDWNCSLCEANGLQPLKGSEIVTVAGLKVCERCNTGRYDLCFGFTNIDDPIIKNLTLEEGTAMGRKILKQSGWGVGHICDECKGDGEDRQLIKEDPDDDTERGMVELATSCSLNHNFVVTLIAEKAMPHFKEMGNYNCGSTDVIVDPDYGSSGTPGTEWIDNDCKLIFEFTDDATLICMDMDRNVIWTEEENQ